jgi:hypothetical protein
VQQAEEAKMIFSNLARICAVLVLLDGLSRILTGLSIANELLGPYQEMLARYTAYPSSGNLIDRGIYGILVAVALGALAEIGIAVRKMSRQLSN